MAKGRPPGGQKYGGRQKGSLNKDNAEIRDMIIGALHQAGGQDYLARQAIENPGPFMGLVGKVLPRDINANVVGSVVIQVVTGVPDSID